MPARKLNRAIKYRAYPTSEQQVLLAKTFGCVRFIWNHMLIDAQQFLNEAGTFFVPTPAKYKKEFPFLKEVDSLALANLRVPFMLSAIFLQHLPGYHIADKCCDADRCYYQDDTKNHLHDSPLISERDCAFAKCFVFIFVEHGRRTNRIIQTVIKNLLR